MNGGLNDIRTLHLEKFQRPLFVFAHEPAVCDDIGDQYGGKAALHDLERPWLAKYQYSTGFIAAHDGSVNYSEREGLCWRGHAAGQRLSTPHHTRSEAGQVSRCPSHTGAAV